ncbi:MAG: DUF4412 domain-containing protein [Proteobacteria bacterium]|nr:DUF4412 domain-containing protein [Pseudomonadota bacterium]
MSKKTVMALGMMVLAIGFLSANVAIAGTVIDQEMTDVWGKKSGLVLYYSKKRLRIDQKDGKLSTILHFRNDRILILDHTSKSYITYPLSSWQKQVAQKIAPQQKEHRKREIRVKSTGVEKTINGFRTTQIRVFLDGDLFQDSWVTRDVDVEEMLEAIKKGIGGPSGLSSSEMEEKEEIYEKVKETGFPILTMEYRQVFGKTLKDITEVKRIETQKLDPRLFSPPKEYRQRTN